MAAQLPLPRDPDERSVIRDLELGRTAARERGWTAQMVDQPFGDESDVRLLVQSRALATQVEVLGPGSHLPPAPCWQAVRVRGGARVVWSGPDRRRDGLLDFVADLLEADDDVLAGRYESLG